MICDHCTNESMLSTLELISPVINIDVNMTYIYSVLIMMFKTC